MMRVFSMGAGLGGTGRGGKGEQSRPRRGWFLDHPGKDIPMKLALLAASATVIATALHADRVTIPSPYSVEETIDRLEAAVDDAGATVFARVDHAEGAASAEMSLAPAQLLIFGNPALGTPAMQDDIEAGLVLPLRVLAYEDSDGGVHLVWTPAADLFAGLEIPADADYVAKIDGALQKLTGAATAE